MSRPRALAPPQIADELTAVDASDLGPHDAWDGALVRGTFDVAAVTAGEMAGLDVTGCRFEAFDAIGLEVERLSLTDVVFEGCDLSGSSFRLSQLRRVEFRDCRMSGVVFPESVWRDVRLRGCKLDGVHLRGLDAERVELERCVLRDADLTAGRWRAGALLACDLEEVRFAGIAAAGLRLHGSDVASIRDAEALRGAVIDEAQVLSLADALLASLSIQVEPAAQATPGSADHL
jgi:uncharacterized protein YjbI with pentapeptide repeats